MIKKQLLIISALLFSVMVFSQEMKMKKPNYRRIKRKISKEKSDYYYPKLMKRYRSSDTTMTLQEKRYLYYGYSFQNNYSPYGESIYIDSLRQLFKKEEYDNKDLLQIIAFSDSVLVKYPFNMRVMNYQLYAYDKLGEKDKFERKISQMKIMVDAILSSGDGLTMKTSFYVIYVSNEYDLLNILGFEFGGEQSLIEHYDYLKVAENPQNIDGFYFDVIPCLNSLNGLFK